MGQRLLSSPRPLSGALISVGTPPDAETRYKPFPRAASGVKTITPCLFHVPPRPEGASQIVCTGPPDTSTFFSFPSAKNARDLPSADQNGKLAPSVPVILFASDNPSS